MKEEISIAASSIIRLLQLTSAASLSNEQFAAFENALNEVLVEQFADHWHVDEPARGHGYRCLRVNMFDRCDPALHEAARRASVRFDALALPDELTIWIDPNEVTLRIGEDKSFSWTLYTVRSGKGESMLESVDFVDVLQRAEELRECDPKWIVYRQSAIRANTRGAPCRGDRKDSNNVRAGEQGVSAGRDSAALNSAYLSNAALYNQHAAPNQYSYPGGAANYYYDYYYYSQFCGYDDYTGSSSMNYSATQPQPYYVPSQKHTGRNANTPNGNPNGTSGAAYTTEHGTAQHRSRVGTAGGYAKLGASALPNGGMMGRGGATLNGYHRSSAGPLIAGRESPVKSPARFNATLMNSASKSNIISLGSQGTLTASNDDLSQNQSIVSTSSVADF